MKTHAEKMQKRIEDLINTHFPEEVVIEVALKPNTFLWRAYEIKVGTKQDVSQAVKAGERPIPFNGKIKGYATVARYWEPSFALEQRHITSSPMFDVDVEVNSFAVYYGCIKSFRVLKNK